MKPKHARLRFILLSLVVMGAATAAILTAFQDTMVFFYTPSQYEVQRQKPGFNAQRSVRIGGLVKKGSIVNQKTGGIQFIVTDLTHDMHVTYRGLIPTLFRDGQGVVAQGTIDAEGILHADTILAKHDETYMPREVVDALKASGRWQEGQAK